MSQTKREHAPSSCGFRWDEVLWGGSYRDAETERETIRGKDRDNREGDTILQITAVGNIRCLSVFNMIECLLWRKDGCRVQASLGQSHKRERHWRKTVLAGCLLFSVSLLLCNISDNIIGLMPLEDVSTLKIQAKAGFWPPAVDAPDQEYQV